MTLEFLCEVEPKTCQEDFESFEQLKNHIMEKHGRTNYGLHLRIKRIEEKLLLEPEKICAIYHFNQLKLFKVHEDNTIKTEFGTFRYDINHAIKSDNMMICYFKDEETQQYEKSLK